MEGLIMSDAVSKIDIGPLLVEQRRTADEYRVAEKVVQDLHKSFAATTSDQGGRAEAEADIVSRTADLMRLGQQMLDLDGSVHASNKARGHELGAPCQRRARRERTQTARAGRRGADRPTDHSPT